MRNRFWIIGCVCLLVLLMAAPIYAESMGGRVRIGGNVHVSSGQIVYGDAVTVFGNQVIEGDVQGSVVSVFGDIELSGHVSGDVVAVFGDVVLKEGARVNGDMVNILGEVERQGTVQIGGQEITMDAGEIGDTIREHVNLRDIHFNWIYRPLHWPFWGLAFSLIWSMVIVLLFAKQIKNMAAAIENDVIRVGLKGLLGTVLVIVAVLVLAITILGIPIALLVGLFTWLAVAFGSVALYYLVGDRLAEQLHWELTDLVKALIGTLLLGLIVLLPLGGIVQFFIGLWALGSVIVTKFGNQQPGIE